MSKLTAGSSLSSFCDHKIKHTHAIASNGTGGLCGQHTHRSLIRLPKCRTKIEICKKAK